MKRFTRLAAVVLVALATVGAFMPPAQATTTIETTFIGTMTVTGGIGYPFITLPDLTTIPVLTCLPLPPSDPTSVTPQCHPVYDHQRPVVFFSNTVCTDEGTHIVKPGKPLESTGPCVITASGTVTGHCGVSGGQLQGAYTDSKGQTYTFSFHFTEVGEWVITGHVTKQSTGRTGKIVGEANAGPVSDPTFQQSCTNKTQRDFIVTGETRVTIITA